MQDHLKKNILNTKARLLTDGVRSYVVVTVTDRQLDRRMNLSSRFPSDTWPAAQAYFNNAAGSVASVTDSIC